MAYKALGMIEVRGMLGSIIAADAALKAADVDLVGNRRIRGGLTTLEVMGDVSAVYAAVEAGVEAVKDLNCLISNHVIPNLDEQVEQMIMASFKKANPQIVVEPEPGVEAEISNEPEEDKTAFQHLKVTELRSLAYQRNITSMSKKEIKFANKSTLINALLAEGVKDE